MFTVKWIAQNGEEMIYAAKNISYSPPAGDDRIGGTGGPAPVMKATVSFDLADGTDVHCSLDSGDVYVMNAFGKTVANYVLSTKEFPHGLMPRAA